MGNIPGKTPPLQHNALKRGPKTTWETTWRNRLAKCRDMNGNAPLATAGGHAVDPVGHLKSPIRLLYVILLYVIRTHPLTIRHLAIIRTEGKDTPQRPGKRTKATDKR